MRLLFIQLSKDRVIGLFGNINEISRLEEEQDDGSIQTSYWVTNAHEPYRLNEQEFNNLMDWATHPSRCVFLTEEGQTVSQYRTYTELGGGMTYDDWSIVFKQYQRLAHELEHDSNPAISHIEKERQLRALLLLPKKLQMLPKQGASSEGGGALFDGDDGGLYPLFED